MNPDSFLQMALQLSKERNHARLLSHARTGLLEQRQAVLPLLSGLLAHSPDPVKTTLYEAMVQDGGVDLMPYLIHIFQAPCDEATLEKRLVLLGDHPQKEALDLAEALKDILGPAREPMLRRLLNKLRARFRGYAQLKQFQQAEGARLEEITQAMLRKPQDEWLEPLCQVLQVGDPEHVRQAARLLVPLAAAEVLSAVDLGVVQLLERHRLAEVLPNLPFLWGDARNWSPRTVLRAYAEQEGLPMGVDEAELLAQQIGKTGSRAEVDHLLAPFRLVDPLLGLVRKRLMRLVTGSGSLPDEEELRKHCAQWQASCFAALRQLVFAGSRLARVLGDAAFHERLAQLIPRKGVVRQVLLVCEYAGQGDADAAQKLEQILDRSTSDLVTRTVLEMLVEVPLDWIPDPVLLLARDPERHSLRVAAIDFLARSPLGQVVLETLLSQGSLRVREDVGACIAAQQLVGLHPYLVGFLNSPIGDSFRLVLLKTLEAFDREETGLPVRSFLGGNHSLAVRLAALHTMMVAGGPHKLELVVEFLSQDVGSRNREQIFPAFLDALAGLDSGPVEHLLLGHSPFVAQLLQQSSAEIRERILGLLERFSWDDPRREGWVGLFQRALQTMVQQRSSEEVERIRALIGRVSARFESERKAVALRRKLDTIASGLNHQLRLERLQALRQLDWIFRPEMIAGDPEGVRRLIQMIERVLENDAGDVMIEVLAIEVAGKIGHPALRHKIREYLDHPDYEVVVAAKRALELPVNQVLLANLIRHIFHIDDSFYMTKLVGTILTQEGYQAEGANGPEEAIELLQRQSFDLLILDLNMPKIRGVDFLKQIRQLDIAPRFTFVLTSVRTQDELVEVFREGVDGVLLKPFRAEELVEKIRELKERFS